jgi:hypothetical protein
VRNYLTEVVGVPVLMWAVCLGCGLALERALRVRLSNAILIPLGLCVAFVLIMPGYAAGAGDALAVALVVTATLAGLAFAQGGLRSRLNPGWPGAAGLGAYILYMLPVIAYGHWTWSGYDFVNDSAFEMLLAVHMQHFGTLLGHIPESSEREFLVAYLNSGYPLGTQGLLGTFAGMVATPVEVLYQGYISGLVAVGAIALATIAQGWLSARRAAFVALVAISANLTYQYALQGGIKEIGLLATLCAAVTLAREAVTMARPYAGAALVAVAAAAALAAYNAVALPFIGALVLFVGIGVMLAQRARPKLTWAGPVAVGAGCAAVLAIPSLFTLRTFFGVAVNGQGATGVGATQFGQLLRKLPLSQLSGVWLTGDYRLPVVPEIAAALTVLATVAILALLVPALVGALRRRNSGSLPLLGMVGLTMAIVYPRVSPYAQGKLLAIAGPAVVLVALAVLASVRGRFAPRALYLLVSLSLAVGASDLLAYGNDPVAPTARIEAIRQVGERFAGQGLVMWNEFEEYAKVFARASRISVPFEALTPEQVQLRSPTYFYGHYFDLDQERLSFVESYDTIVTRRSPSASRPPANYRLVYQNAYYLGWRRTARPEVLRHLPEQRLYSPTDTVTCSALEPIASHAPAGSELVVAKAPELVWFEPLFSPDRSNGWGADPNQAGAVVTYTPGHASGELTVAGHARYVVWVQGDFPRPLEVQLDGRTVGSVSGTDTPGQWTRAATVDLAPGTYRAHIFRPGGHRWFGPGEWRAGTIGAVALQREEPERMLTVAPARWRTLCGTQADWVELVRP